MGLVSGLEPGNNMAVDGVKSIRGDLLHCEWMWSFAVDRGFPAYWRITCGDSHLEISGRTLRNHPYLGDRQVREGRSVWAQRPDGEDERNQVTSHFVLR